jgi:prevent-host-death family protein
LQSGEVAVKYHLVRTELVTTLKRRATQIIASLTENRDPILITQHGRPAAYLVDVETYEGMNDRLAILEIIGRGERALQEGRLVPHKKARQRMSRWLK